MFQSLISVAEAKQCSAEAIFVDCRHQLSDTTWGERQYHLGHIAQARFAHLDRDLSSPVIQGQTGRHPLPTPAQLNLFFSQLGIRPQTQVIAYDQDLGMFAARFWWLLRAMGHTRVAVLDGGYRAWLAEGGAVEAHTPCVTPSEFLGKWQGRCLSSAEVQTRLYQPHVALLDARQAERFSGQEEPIDAKAGHIPSALNMPFTANCQDGFWRSAAELHARFSAVLQPEVICYCGSGVTACHTILAMVHAQLNEPYLYAGSWSEWITDERRPIARETG
ncbi:sulfurtransferase [Agitococcus lubricus]|uniref:Thiosulfate/3-mercaptopyruvate sulfurtransferase n=1 Tax=Agitococcus lubricus TaxID=1077255 RepID=A0A2T5J2T1_9GAMM|nr:sulfurtransferase [Agitococcus lubricus]PTQ90829.1 thiosulfate/3-mercaptopyruvate sulfurtransferase [Agitococcus lubricus]